VFCTVSHYVARNRRTSGVARYTADVLLHDPAQGRT